MRSSPTSLSVSKSSTAAEKLQYHTEHCKHKQKTTDITHIKVQTIDIQTIKIEELNN